jgi:hypothetical protein
MDWTNKCPPYDSQYSATTHIDAQDCVEESLCHIVYMLTGQRYSPRALAYLTDVTPTGSSFEQALKTVNAYGLIPYDLWPTPDSFTWETYYAPIPQNILSQAVSYHIEEIAPNLDLSPLWTVLQFGTASSGVIPEQHAVAQINDTQYFDSETGSPIKPLNYEGATIVYQTSISLTPLIMPQFKTQNYKGELRIVLQADDETTWQALCKVYGLDPNAAPSEVV